ncbi:MAG: 2-dehydropantoate 2-reductase, partial [Desulfobacterales bacterium]|nr:2-dehydropantoate 2-reductase [Desulfobacterales bacterium]
AMGCLFAARLKKAGHAVTLFDYKTKRADLITRQGINVEGISGEYNLKVPTVSDKISEPPDAALICVKANQTRRAAEDIKPGLSPETRIVTLQNGLGNLEILQEIFGEERVLGGVTAEGATLLGPGHVRHAGQGATIIGPEETARKHVADLVSAFSESGFDTRSADNVSELIWGKLIINVGINALTAITRLKNGRLPDINGTRMVLEQAVQEAVAVADAKGINLPYPDPIKRVLEVCDATAGNIASMLQDVLKKRITEVAFINGAIVREGKVLGILTPVNHTLTCLVQALQETYEEGIWE